MDEGFMGGRYKSGKYNKKQKEAIRAKSVVIGAVERGGDIRAEVSKDSTAYSIGKFLTRNIERENTVLLTDASNRYDNVAKKYNRYSVNHTKGEFVRGIVHVNSIEGFWSHLKKSIKGTHKVISKKHLQSYVDAFVFHYNNRYNDKDRFSVLVSCLVSE